MKIVLFGATGQVGSELRSMLPQIGEVSAPHRDEQSGFCGDFLDPVGIRQTIRRLQPDVIVNAAAYTAVDRAENEVEIAEQVNAVTPGVIAEEARRLGAWIVHYSTDYVFDGTGTRAWREDDQTGPVNVYGRSKLSGEKAIIASGCDYLILRTSWVYGLHGNNFVKTVIKLARERQFMEIVADQYGAPTGAEVIARMTIAAIKRVVRDKVSKGIYHLAAAGETTWFDVAQHIVKTARKLDQQLMVEEIRAVTTDQYKTAARRPLNSRLDCYKFRSTFAVDLPEWESGVDAMLVDYLGGKNE